jgi:hypothetical protein
MNKLATIGIYPKCVYCGGSIVYGEPHRMDYNDTVQIWCQECITDYSIAMWPESFGPCPHQQHKPGRA